jgi:hypothetical protein
MPRVVPSQVVATIESRFKVIIDPGQARGFTPIIRGFLSGLLRLLDKIPEELLQLSASDYADFITAVEALRTCADERGPTRNYGPIEMNAIRDIHRLLQACPDDAPSPSTSDPAFVTDPQLRTDLHRDLGEVNRALQNGEWKGATVLAGSVVEALLLWALQNKKTGAEIQAAAAGLGKTIDLTKRPLERWDLYELIEYAEATGLISASTRAAADQGRDFRNLIHPGKAQRLAQKCNRATALLGVGAVEAVVEDLS